MSSQIASPLHGGDGFGCGFGCGVGIGCGRFGADGLNDGIGDGGGDSRTTAQPPDCLSHLSLNSVGVIQRYERG